MLIVKIVGGLGNQMFQYAMAKSLSLGRESQLRVDTSTFKNRKYINPEGYLLKKIFNVPDNEASISDYIKVLGIGSITLPLIKRNKILTFTKKHVINENKAFHFEDKLILKNKPVSSYILGYWQSELYFQRHASEIRKLFQFQESVLSLDTKNLLKKIKSCNAISLHVRRGDYISNPSYRKIYNHCNIEYYKRAKKIVSTSLENIKYFIFTDDISWVRAQPEFVDCIIATNQDTGSWNDLYLMSQCKHHIISNSSFSWWGAWLNDGDKKIVVSPNQWFKDGTVTKDLLPKSWITI
jgi:hypothetical protein